MSYDISLKIDTGLSYTTIWDGNITSNIRKMYNKAFNADYWVSVVDDELAKDVSLLILKAYQNMRDNKELIKPLEAKNGWGTYEQALKFLLEFYDATLSHGNCTISICR